MVVNWKTLAMKIMLLQIRFVQKLIKIALWGIVIT